MCGPNGVEGLAGLACAALLALACGGEAPAASAPAAHEDAAPASEATVGVAASEAPLESPEPPRGLPAGARRVQPAVILDATGFEAPIAASTLLLPHGWKTQGGISWGREFMCTNGYVFDWSATSPDGAMRIAVLPQQRWESNDYGAGPSAPGCALAPYTNVRQVLEAMAARLRPDAQIEGFRVRDDLQRDLARFNQVTPMPMGETRSWVEAGELSLAFTENGRAMKASVAAAAVFSLMRTQVAGMGSMAALTGSTFPAWAVSAPADRFDAEFFEAIRRSIRAAPEWESRIAGHNAAIGRVALEEARKRSAAIAESNEAIARIRNEAWSAQQESADRRAREFGELIKGVETYDDANAPGGQVELSSQADHAWRLDDGSYVLTTDPSFDPWRDLGVEGHRLEATR